MQPLKLSVMMPNYNHGRYIADALDAIVNQSFQPFEVIVCDDGSTDDSVQIIRRFAERYPFVRLIRNDTNLGVFPTLDKLLASVSGDYLYSAAADDKILPGFFEKSMKLLMQYPQAGICSTLSFIINEEGKRKGWVLNPVISTKSCFFSPDRVRDIFLKQGSWTFGITSIMRFDYISANGGYRPELYAFSDGFLNEMMALKYGACFIPDPLTSWRRLGNNYSMTISSKPEIYAKLIENATSLMQARSPEIFPKEYIEAWRRQNYFYLHYNICNKTHQEKLLEIFTLGKTAGFAGRFWVWWLNRFFFLEKILIICYLFFVFKRDPWRACFNRIKYFFLICRFEFHEKLLRRAALK